MFDQRQGKIQIHVGKKLLFPACPGPCPCLPDNGAFFFFRLDIAHCLYDGLLSPLHFFGVYKDQIRHAGFGVISRVDS